MKLSIRYKFIAGFCIIFAVSAYLLNFYVSDALNKNNLETITADMAGLQKSSREYLKQYFFINNLTIDSFQREAKYIAQDLARNFGVNVALYDARGNFLCEGVQTGQPYIILNNRESETLRKSSRQDLAMALENKSAFKANAFDGKFIVNLSYPLYINGEYYGILRFTKDYSSLYASSLRIKSCFLIFTALLFFFAFMLSIALSNGIIKPIIELAAALKQVALGNYDININIRTGDEIQELGRSFHYMKDKIKQQFDAICREKEKVMKLEKARSEFFNNVTHELKTPLATISGYAQIIGAKDFCDREFLMKAARKIQSESERLHRMVVSLIEISKKNTLIEQEPFKTIDVKHLLQGICEDMQLKASKFHIKIRADLANLHIKGNENKLRQLFINVLDNAVKYGSSHSTIKVLCKEEAGFAKIEMENEVECIDDSVFKKAFEPFYRGNTSAREKGSSGLGLYICKTIVEEHGGTIEMTGQENRVKITIKIPLRQHSGNN